MTVENRNQIEDAYSEDLPAWARDNLVLKLLDDKGLKLEVMYDQEYLRGIYDTPLIVIRGKR